MIVVTNKNISIKTKIITGTTVHVIMGTLATVTPVRPITMVTATIHAIVTMNALSTPIVSMTDTTEVRWIC